MKAKSKPEDSSGKTISVTGNQEVNIHSSKAQKTPQNQHSVNDANPQPAELSALQASNETSNGFELVAIKK